jgi:hypothetical protein
MIASLRPDEAIEMWDWLMDSGYFTPLTNVESLMFPAGSSCDSAEMAWNHLKGSWNLALQALSWGGYLAERDGQVPILWQATTANPLLGRGYLLLVPSGSSSNPTPTPPSTQTTWSYERECEFPDEATVGQMIQRSSASGSKVHGQFGTTANSPWPAKPGHVKYDDITIPQLDRLYLKLRYSKHSPSSVPILIYLDDETSPRVAFDPIDQGNWDRFAWTEPILVGSVGSGVHSISLSTDGQQYGVADLDTFVLMAGSAPTEARSMPIAVYMPQPSETPVTPIWDHTQMACEGRPTHTWNSPGTYLYRITDNNGSQLSHTVEQKSIVALPGNESCSEAFDRVPNPPFIFGNVLLGPPQTGNSKGWSTHCSMGIGTFYRDVSLNFVGSDRKRTGLGIFQSERINSIQEYHIFSDRHDILNFSVESNEWYVCGYGLIYSTATSTGLYNGGPSELHSEIELLSFTPTSTNESHVRHILLDLQLGNVQSYYRAHIADEETAEAMRRWDAGVRIENIEKFDRKTVNGQWQLVYEGTEDPVIGADIVLTSDLQQ